MPNKGDKVRLKKDHACGANLWEVIRTGADYKLKCINCSHIVLISRLDLDKRLKEVIYEEKKEA